MLRNFFPLFKHHIISVADDICLIYITACQYIHIQVKSLEWGGEGLGSGGSLADSHWSWLVDLEEELGVDECDGKDGGTSDCGGDDGRAGSSGCIWMMLVALVAMIIFMLVLDIIGPRKTASTLDVSFSSWWIRNIKLFSLYCVNLSTFIVESTSSSYQLMQIGASY